MMRFMILATLVLSLPEFVGAADPNFKRPTPIGVNSHAFGTYVLSIFDFCGGYDGDFIQTTDDGVDSASVLGDGMASLNDGTVASNFYANVATNAPQGASTISGSLSAVSNTEANISNDPNDPESCFTYWEANENLNGHRAQADFNDSFTIDGDVLGSPVTVHSTITIFAQVEVDASYPSFFQYFEFSGPGFAGTIYAYDQSVDGQIEFTDDNGVPTVTEAIDFVDRTNGVLTISGTINVTDHSYQVGDSVSIDVFTFADSYGIGYGSGSASGFATLDWSTTVVAQP